MAGRSYRAQVVDNDCEAPAGFGTAAGAGPVSGVRRSDLHACAHCGDLVRGPCSREVIAPKWMRRRKPVRVCRGHDVAALDGYREVPA